MMRSTTTFLAVLTLSATAFAQDAVQLRSGRYIAGIVQIDEADREGFKIQRWDTGVSVYVRWSQLPETEINRLLKKTVVAGPVGEMLDGLRIITTNREVIGVLAKEDAQQLLVKTSAAKTPAIIPKTAILSREDLKVRETDAFSPEEMVDRRAAKADEKSAAEMLKLGEFAAALKLYERARDFITKAGVADPARKEEIDAILEKNEILIKEGKAFAVLAAVKKLVSETEFAKAIEEARKLDSEFAGTDVAKQNKDLVATIEKAQKDYEANRAGYLAKEVPDRFKAKRSAILSQLSSARSKFAESRGGVSRIDDQALAAVAKDLKSTPDEVRQAWEKRDPKLVRTVRYGDGGWIARGGQEGGLDTDEKLDPPQQKQKQRVNDPNLPFGGGGSQQPQKPAKPVDLGKPMPTSEQWWTGSSSSDRREWLETEYAMTSSMVKKVKEEVVKCKGPCKGEGTYKQNRMGKTCDIKCIKCHGAKDEDVVVQYY